MPTPKPDAAALSEERVELFLNSMAKANHSYRLIADTGLALLAEREEARALLAEAIAPGMRAQDLSDRIRVHLSGKRSTEEGGVG